MAHPHIHTSSHHAHFTNLTMTQMAKNQHVTLNSVTIPLTPRSDCRRW
jgi:hypothetical protein